MIPINSAAVLAGGLPSYTYRLTEERVRGYVDGLSAVKQAVYKILMTERYKYLIYGFNYGVELDRLIGRSKSEAKALLPDIIKSALLCDSRILDTGDFEFEDIDKASLLVSFAVSSTEGKFDTEVTINV